MPVYVEHVPGSHEGADSDQALAMRIIGFRDWGVGDVLCSLNEKEDR
jgi:hypothetical protein